ncbi:hypothetical protein HELRODRAFT_64375 [Helobdella robusta]|uniref:Phospholipase A2-like central domain-containing protein n=1 Tax=Helobdella robusta TaxID=6412 RepID=T1FXT9_HELRO|nr:hypothetical protein HELRODRAFT_64375 [Helobdella robusta]ESO06186.1 hypothetical protein HELRODRAFT_64375 [Helobdella robusta]
MLSAGIGAQRWAIPYGTTWCGPGNISRASNVAEGYFKKIDRCCMIHDHCNDTIASLSMKYSYFNFRPWTISDCECDEEFRLCLQNSYTPEQKISKMMATRIGELFFNNLNNVCFRPQYNKVCASWNDAHDCTSYKMKTYIKIYDLALYE